MPEKSDCKCACGATHFSVTGPARFRMICHCSICQRFNSAPFADVLVYAAGQVADPPEGTVDFRTFKPPPNVQRGRCKQCNQPALEVFEARFFPSLRMVPRAMHGETADLPAPCAHVFYEGRQADADDDLAKHTSFVRSQLAFFRYWWKFRPARTK